MNVEFIQRTIEGYGRVEDVIVDGGETYADRCIVSARRRDAWENSQ